MTGLFSNAAEPDKTTPRRRMQSHTKSRGGCITCKIRRKKCDEERPSCRRCTDTGRKCDGYSVELTRTDGENKRKSLFPFHSPIQYDCSWAFLEIFRTQTIPAFSNYYDSTLWEITLAQTSVSEVVLQSAAVAFAAAHYEYEADRNRGLAVSSQNNLAMALYTDAISKARHALTKSSLTADAVRIGFIVSFMLAGIETLRGSKNDAALHLANGLKIAFSQGHDTIKTSWKTRESGLLLRDAVLALIARLKVAIEAHFNGNCHGDNSMLDIHEKLPGSRHYLHDVFQEISKLIDHIVVWSQDSATDRHSACFYSKALEHCSMRLQKSNLNSCIDHRCLRLLRLYREATHLLVICHINDITTLDNKLSSQHSNTEFGSRSMYLRAYFSKLSMIEEQLRHDSVFTTHLTPASLKRFAVRHSLVCSSSAACDTCIKNGHIPLRSLYSEIEQLIMLEEDAIMDTNLVPAHATCMEVTSALEKGSVSIRYCVVSKEGESFDWVERKASLWKPIVFIQGHSNA